MPTNVTPEYKKAEAAFRRARDPAERLECLREMYRTVPKHKGTEHLRADIKTRMKELTAELRKGAKGAARSGPATVIPREGAAQIALLGPPNSGKSALHARLTGSHTESEPYPFATRYPRPGMLTGDDVQLQLVDLPSIAAVHPIPWIVNALQPADACLLVVDLSSPGCLDRISELHDVLAARRVRLTDRWPNSAESESAEDLFGVLLPTLLIANKADLLDDPQEEIAVFEDLTGLAYPALAVSATTGAGLDAIGPWLREALAIVRVYTKVPGKPADRDRPFTVRHGDTVLDVARLVHRDMAQSLRFARIWGAASFDGQQVGPDHIVTDGDVVELHT